MNRLHERHASGADREELGQVLSDLATFTVQHFEHEEAHMAAVGFPELRTHKRVHKQLLEKFVAYQEAFEAGGELTEEFFDFLHRWLRAHIRGIDRRYGQWEVPKSA